MCKLVFDIHTGLCEVKDTVTLKTISQFETAYTVYNRQYPPPHSDDGEFVVLGDWERATYCYCIKSGELVWEKGPGRVRHLFFSPDCKTIIAHMNGRGIFQRDSLTGELIESIKMTGIEVFCFDETRTWVFAGPKNLYYFIYDVPSLKMSYKIPKRVIDINRCLSFRVDSVATFSNQSIIVSGTEGHPNMDYSDKSSQYFTRVIDISPYSV